MNPKLKKFIKLLNEEIKKIVKEYSPEPITKPKTAPPTTKPEVKPKRRTLAPPKEAPDTKPKALYEKEDETINKIAKRFKNLKKS